MEIRESQDGGRNPIIGLSKESKEVRHSEMFEEFNHSPFIQPWAIQGLEIDDRVAEGVTYIVGSDIPIQYIHKDILAAFAPFVYELGAKLGAIAYLKAIGRRKRALIRSLRRNYRLRWGVH